MFKNQYYKIRAFTLFLSAFFIVNVFAGQTEPMSQQALLKVLKSSPDTLVVLDVRSKLEYTQGHIAGAINISHDEIEHNLAQLHLFRDKKVVVYCRSGRRASIAEHILSENGFNKLYHLTGDMNGWLDANLPVVSSKIP